MSGSRQPADDADRPPFWSEFEAVLAAHEEGLLRYAARILADPNAAQDVVQETFSRLLRHWEEQKGGADSVGAWLYRVTHNLAVDHIRHESRLRLLHVRHARERQESAAAVQGAETARREDAELVWQHVRGLDPRDQQALILRIEGGKSYREIGGIMGLSEGNVGFILHHALKRLAESLKRAGVI